MFHLLGMLTYYININHKCLKITYLWAIHDQAEEWRPPEPYARARKLLQLNASFNFSEIIYSSLWMTSDLLSVRSEFLCFEF